MTSAATEMGDPIRVVVVDDQELVRMGFRLILERAGFEVLGEAADGLDAVALVEQTWPDVVLMDIRMPRLDRIEATRRIVAAGDGPRVVVLTTFDLDDYGYSAIRARRSGFLLKDVSPDDLVHGVRVVARGDAMLAPAVTSRLLEQFVRRPPAGELPAALAALTERETAVARLVARGLTNSEIGEQLYLSEATVKTYVSRLLAKLGLRDRVQVAVLAYESGLVQVGDTD